LTSARRVAASEAIPVALADWTAGGGWAVVNERTAEG
jgi:hypothetical protein